jgi:hypothetical protein
MISLSKESKDYFYLIYAAAQLSVRYEEKIISVVFLSSRGL